MRPEICWQVWARVGCNLYAHHSDYKDVLLSIATTIAIPCESVSPQECVYHQCPIGDFCWRERKKKGKSFLLRIYGVDGGRSGFPFVTCSIEDKKICGSLAGS